MKICSICKIIEKVTKSAREIEKSLAGIEETIKKAVREMRGENGSDKQ